MDCPACGSANPEGKRFCGDCGEPLPQRCHVCGAENPPGKKFCGECGAAFAKSPAAPPAAAKPAAAEAERRQLSVLFCDLVGSTALAERLDPEDLREVIGTYHRCAADTVGSFGGFVAKYMGDGVLVYFGYPQAHEDDAERAVRAGLALVDAIGGLGTLADARLQVRIGIATGVVVVGDLIGAGDAQERGVVGETPNLAARLEALAEPGTVVIAPNTRQLIGGLFECRDLGPIEIKGLREPVRAWQVIRASAVESRFEALHATASLTPLVGREEEIDLLLRRWAQAKGGEGRVVLVSGEPGIGKSRLVAAFEKQIETDPHTRLRYFCSPYHSDSALHPVISQLASAAGFEREETAERKLRKLEALFAQASPSAEDVALLADLLSLPPGASYAPPVLTPHQKKEKTFHALLRQLDSLARRSPVLMTFEDVHWIDPTSLELLSHIIDRVLDLPVLVLVAFRPEFQPPWHGQAHVATLLLSRLARRQSNEIIAGITDGKALPPEVLDQIIARTDGVPLFVEELTKTVLESGLLQKQADRYVLTGPLPALAIPTSLHASLVARLDRFAPVKDVAQVGAAIGREFSYELLSAVAELPAATLLDALRRLVDAQLVFQRGTPPDATYSFKHALVQDAAYGTLLRDRRQQIHNAIKTVLEARFPDLAEIQPELIAHHCAQAGLAEQAVHYLERAGRRAAQRSANREAAGHFRRALELLEGLPAGIDRTQRELRLLVALGPALMTFTTSSAPEVDALYARARQLGQDTGTSSELFPAVWGSWLVAFNAGDLPAARRVENELFNIAQAERDPGLLLQAHHAAWPADLSEGRFATARQHIEAGLALYRPDAHGQHALLYGGHDPCVCAYTLDAMILAALGHLDRALGRVQQALALAQSLSHPPTLAHALAFGGDAHYLCRDPKAAEEFAEKHLSLASEFGSAVGIANATMLRGWARIARGQVDEGCIDLRAGLATWRATGSRFHMPYRLARVADGFFQAGRAEEALALIEEALGAIARLGERWFAAEVHRLHGELQLGRGGSSQEEAEASFCRALQIAREQDARLFLLRAACGLARFWRDRGRRTEAQDLLAPVYARFTEGFDTPDLKEAKALLDELA